MPCRTSTRYLDGDKPPQSVLELRYEVGLADGLLISSPEYAHGVPGCLKNALDGAKSPALNSRARLLRC